eukprot:Awhi_evm1s3915
MESNSDLKTIVLSGNQLTEIPTEIEKLKNLRKIYADDNGIKHIPDSLNELKSLVLLDLYSNKIESLSPFQEKIL